MSFENQAKYLPFQSVAHVNAKTKIMEWHLFHLIANLYELNTDKNKIVSTLKATHRDVNICVVEKYENLYLESLLKHFIYTKMKILSRNDSNIRTQGHGRENT